MPSKQPEYVDATGFLTIEPVFKTYLKDEQGRPVLDSARIVGVTKNRPERKTRTGTVVTKVTLRIDVAAMLPLAPEAVIHVHAGDVETIEVMADNPGYPEPDPELELGSEE